MKFYIQQKQHVRYDITTVIQITINNIITDPQKYYIQVYKFYTVTPHKSEVHTIQKYTKYKALW